MKMGKMNLGSPRLDQHRRDGYTEVYWLSRQAMGWIVSEAERASLREIVEEKGHRPVRGREYFAIAADLSPSGMATICEAALAEVVTKTGL